MPELESKSASSVDDNVRATTAALEGPTLYGFEPSRPPAGDVLKQVTVEHSQPGGVRVIPVSGHVAVLGDRISVWPVEPKSR